MAGPAATVAAAVHAAVSGEGWGVSKITAEDLDKALVAARELIAQRLGIQIKSAVVSLVILTDDGRKIGGSAVGPGAVQFEEVVTMMVGHQRVVSDTLSKVSDSVSNIDGSPRGALTKLVHQIVAEMPEATGEHIDRSRPAPKRESPAGPQSFTFKFPNG